MSREIWTLAGSAEKIAVRNIYAIGWNYAEHNKELGRAADVPVVVFQKSSGALIGDGESLPYPPNTSDLQYEGELVALIGEGGRRIPREKALDHVWGYAAGIDFTLRDVQKEAKAKGQPWFASKNFEGAAAVGAFSPKSALPDVAGGVLTLKVNGAVKQSAKFSQMANDVSALVSRLSDNLPLLQGDAIFTGTPAGVGPVKPGDLVVCAIEASPAPGGKISALSRLSIRITG